MARYIDADELKARYRKGKSLPERVEFAILVEETPSADVSPVVHAKWHIYDTAIDSYQTILECSYCQYDFTFENLELGTIKYCPHCGAIMDGEAGV